MHVSFVLLKGGMANIRVVSWNVNGLRSCSRQGFEKWFASEAADVICLQEIKAFPTQISTVMLNPLKYESYWHPAERPGYAGVAAYSKKKPLDVRYGIGKEEFDKEGRVITLEYKNFIVINAYFPHSRRDHSRLPFKLKFCAEFAKHCAREQKRGKTLVIGGDFNIAPHELDLANPKSNRDNAGFLPEERNWIAKFYKKGYVDTFREFTEGNGHYTFWSRRPGARTRNVGWRIDYFLIDKDSRNRLKSSIHQPTIMGSDHCPIVVTIKN
jgi:exodeoxyribonuclease-3